jgi:hypothetical protein
MEGFGRFGYSKVVRLPGLEISQQGIRALNSNSDLLAFMQPLKQWQPVESSVWRQTVLAEGGPGKPSKLRFDLFDYGVGIYCPAGLEFRVRATGAPRLSWTEASIGPGYPTPDADWLALSFQDKQPPIVFGFPDSKTNLQIDGEPGNWIVHTPKNFKGWIRVALPFGTEPLQTTTVGSFGRLSKRCKEYEPLWFGAMRDTPEPEIEEDAQGLELTWQLPRARTVIPNSFYLSQIGGYPVKINSGYDIYPTATNEGPLVLTNEPIMKIRFPIKRIPIGRGLTLGEPILQSMKAQSWSDPLALLNTALANTLCGRSSEQSDQARELLQSYYDVYVPQQEPLTKLSTFYKQDGSGLLTTAIHGFLAQSIRTGQPSEETEDPQLISLFWRLDPYSGSMAYDRVEERRVKAIAAVAGCFSSSVSMRLRSALFQASLSGERGFNIWRRRQGMIAVEPKLLEPLLGIRKGLFALTQASTLDPVLSNWLSEIRCYGDNPTWLSQTEFGLDLCWNVKTKQFGTISIESAYPMNFSSKKNLQSMYSSQRIGYQELRYEPSSIGQCSANVYLPDWCEAIPLTTLPPSYQEAIQ